MVKPKLSMIDLANRFFYSEVAAYGQSMIIYQSMFIILIIAQPVLVNICGYSFLAKQDVLSMDFIYI